MEVETKFSEFTDDEIRELIQKGVEKYNDGKTHFSHPIHAAGHEVLSTIYGFPMLNPTKNEHERFKRLLLEIL